MEYSADKLGFYQVNGLKTYSKFNAISYANKNHMISWNFNDEVFKKYRWDIEPTVDLNTLYVKRALQLREDYDYLVLFYSSGSDSQTILDVFLNNNIKIDEIAVGHSLTGSGTTGYFNEEIIKVANPILKQIKESHPLIKIRHIDHTDYILNAFEDENWIFDNNNFLTPNHVVRALFRETIPEYKALHKSCNLGFVYGIEKPFVYIDDYNRYYIQFDDYIGSCYNPYGQDRNWQTECFFSDPQCTDLICKQAHLIVNELKSNNLDDKFYRNEYTKYGKHFTKDKYLTANGCISIIYPDFDITTYSNGKNPSMVYGARDKWFVDNHKHTSAYKNWLQGLNKIKELYYDQDPNISYLNTDKIIDGIKGLTSPRYYITFQ